MKFLFFANTDWYLYNFRLATAQRLRALGHDVVMVSPPGDFGARFAPLGFRWVTLPMDRASVNPLREAMTVSRLVRVLRHESPDLLHSFTVKCAVYGSVAARVVRTPAVVSAVAGMGYVFSSESVKARVLRPMVRSLMRATLGAKNALLVLQNPDDAEAFKSANIVAANRIRVIRSSGVNTERFRPYGARRSSTNDSLRVVLAARLIWDKGIREFIDAAKMLRERGRNIEFLLAGSPDPGNPNSVATEQVRTWADAGLVRWLGHVEDMASLLKSADVITLPSYYREGVPKSLIEGGACGLAIVTTGQPGCREVVTEDGVNGLVVPPRDAPALAHAIARLDDDRELLLRLGQRARQRALDHFDERLVTEQTVQVYSELLRGRGPLSAARGE